MKHIYSLFSILFAALLMAGCVNDPDIDGGIRNAKKPSVKTDEILKSTASSVTVSGEVLQENGAPVTEAGFGCRRVSNDGRPGSGKLRGRSAQAPGLVSDAAGTHCHYSGDDRQLCGPVPGKAWGGKNGKITVQCTRILAIRAVTTG